MNNSIPLAEFMEGKTQTKVARMLGITQGGLRKMINSGRDIRVNVLLDGTIKAYEIREVPARKPQTTAA